MTAVPVMSFHSVGDAPLPWDLRHLSTTPEVLEGVLRWLSRRGFQSLTLAQLHQHLVHGTEVPERSLVLAFDDGYLDNWVYVHPLLKKYGQRGVIFVSGDFVTEADSVRPNMEDVAAGRLRREDLPGLGYCSWEELRQMSAAGTLEVQSHLMTHGWLPQSERIAGFHTPDQPAYVQAWNADAAGKSAWLDWGAEGVRQRYPLGAPLYESARSHVAPACRPDPALGEALAAHAAAHGGELFFAREDWRFELEEVAEAVRADPPKFESREEFEARFEAECVACRRLIEEHVPGAEARFMAWPGGEFDTRLQEIALRHYDATYTTEFGVTLPGADPLLVKRSFFAQRGPELTGWTWPSVLHFIGRMQRLRGRSLYRAHTFVANRALRWRRGRTEDAS